MGVLLAWVVLAIRQAEAFQKTRQVGSAERLLDHSEQHAGKLNKNKITPGDLANAAKDVIASAAATVKAQEDAYSAYHQGERGANKSVERVQMQMDQIEHDALSKARLLMQKAVMTTTNLTSDEVDAMLQAVDATGPKGLHNIREAFDYPTNTSHETKQYAEGQILALNVSVTQDLRNIVNRSTVNMQQSIGRARRAAEADLERLLQAVVLGLQQALDEGNGVEASLQEKLHYVSRSVAFAAEYVAQKFNDTINNAVQHVADIANSSSSNASVFVHNVTSIFGQVFAANLDPMTDIILELEAIQESLDAALRHSESFKAAALATLGAQRAAVSARQENLRAITDLYAMLNVSREQSSTAASAIGQKGAFPIVDKSSTHAQVAATHAAEDAELLANETALLRDLTNQSYSGAKTGYTLAKAMASEMEEIIVYAAAGVNSTAAVVNKSMDFFQKLNQSLPQANEIAMVRVSRS